MDGPDFSMCYIVEFHKNTQKRKEVNPYFHCTTTLRLQRVQTPLKPLLDRRRGWSPCYCRRSWATDFERETSCSLGSDPHCHLVSSLFSCCLVYEDFSACSLPKKKKIDFSACCSISWYASFFWGKSLGFWGILGLGLVFEWFVAVWDFFSWIVSFLMLWRWWC